MITPYVLPPEWEWILALEMFAAGVAAGTILFIAFANLAGDQADREVAARAGVIAAPLMLLVAVLLVVDLGQPGRFLNLILRSPGAVERGPSPLMFNASSPMSWGSYVIGIFGIFTAVSFADALVHVRRFALPRGLVEAVAHNPVFHAVSGVLALATAAYSGVLINVSNQGVWSDTFMLGSLYVAFSALSGMAVAAIASDTLRAGRTAGAVRFGLAAFAGVCALLLAIFVAGLASSGDASSLVATLHEFVGPLFWLAVIAAVLVPLALAIPRSALRAPGRMATVGVIVLIGVLAFRAAMLYSSIAFVQG